MDIITEDFSPYITDKQVANLLNACFEDKSLVEALDISVRIFSFGRGFYKYE